MKRIFATLLLTAACLMAQKGASAQDMMQATIPFDFTVGQKLLPSGTYSITYVQPRVIAFNNRAKAASVFSVFVSDDNVKRNPHKLVFIKLGDQYFLSEVRGGLGEFVREIGTSNLEKRIRVEHAALVDQQKAEIALK